MKHSRLSSQVRNRILVVCGAVFIIVVALVLFVNANSQRVVEQNAQYLESSTSQTARRLNDVFETAMQNTQAAAAIYGQAIIPAPQDSYELLSVFGFSQFDNTFFVDDQGRAYTSNGRSADVSYREYYKEGMKDKTGACFVNEGTFDGQNVVAFYAPVKTNGKVIGVIVSVFREDSLTELMTTDFYGEPTPTYLCEPDGTIVASADSVKPDVEIIDEVLEVHGITKNDLTVINERTDVNQVKSYTYQASEGMGNTCIASLPEFDWVIIRSFPTSITNDMISSANFTGFILVGGVLVAALLVIVLLIVQSRKENRELLLERQEATRIIDASTNLFSNMISVDLIKGTYELLKSDTATDRLPSEGKGSDLRRYFESVVDLSESPRAVALMTADKVKEALPPGITFIQEEAHTKTEKDRRWYQTSIICLARDDEGRPISVLLAIQDITESKTRELASRNALEDAFRAAEHASRAKSDFLNSMSHDIRTPMNSIMGLTAIAGMHVEEPDRVRDCLNNITSASRHLLGLINEVLDMAKIESGSIDLADEPFDLSESIENLITIMNPQITAKHQELKVDLVDIKHEYVIGDPTRLQQIFVNIMSNSVKFTPEGGTIGLRISELTSHIPGSGCYEFVFSDTGCGMSKEFMQRIFEPFARANDSRTTKVEGTGLGMAIVKSVITLMNGTIDVESTEGEGTTFTVTIHLKQRDGVQEDLSELKDIRVLVVDDDMSTCEDACLLLDDIGMRSAFALSGQAGIDMVSGAIEKEDPFRACILDWRMPEMSGLEAARRIREIAPGNVPIIILSAYDWSMIEQEARQVGVDAFISKPLFRSRLVQVMKELLTGEKKSALDEKAMLEGLTYEGKRVLLTEDNSMAAEIAKELIGMTGASVERAENGQMALDMMLVHDPGYYDIVLMDIQMPIMNGYEAAEAIRSYAAERPDMGEIPIVALTADAFAEDIRRAHSSGMNDHMSKPLEIELLVRMLQKWLR